MAEVGNMPLPPKVLKKGITDMVRLSDARMSGTAYGTIILHVAPEAAAGGPLGLVQSGDRIRLSVRERRLDLLVDDAELQRRRTQRTPKSPSETTDTRGYGRLFHERVLQAPDGCDFDFLRPHGR